jgi:SAM-dependent methyltransferase
MRDATVGAGDLTDALSEQQRLYSDSGGAVRAKGFTEESARAYYAEYVQFVLRRVDRPGGRLLDVGCGGGWSSYLFARLSFDVTGMDLNPASVEAPPAANLRFAQGDARALPFDDGAFDVVASYQALEHVPDPQAALGEMLRVLRPGGLVCVVGPNLLSALASLRGLGWYVWRNRPVATIFVRRPGMPRHPWGNTIPEVLALFVRNAFLLASKLVSPRARFSLRAPDTRPPFHSDNDACYLCNPVDLVKFFRSRGCTVVKNGRDGRPPLTWLVATGTYVAARKNGPDPPRPGPET